MNNSEKPLFGLWETRTIAVEGMTCDHCARALTRGLQKVPGVKEVRVDLAGARAEVTFDSTKAGLPAIEAAIVHSGYKPGAEIKK